MQRVDNDPLATLKRLVSPFTQDVYNNSDDCSHVAVKPEDDDSIESNEELPKVGFSPKGVTTNSVHTDRFGFHIREEIRGGARPASTSRIFSKEEEDRRLAKETERLQKWGRLAWDYIYALFTQFSSIIYLIITKFCNAVKMLKRWDFTLKNRRDKLKRRIRKGIPDAVRAKVWLNAVRDETKKWRRSHPIKLLKENVARGAIDSQTLEDIEKDVDRTFPNHVLFEGKESLGQKTLRTILQWYAVVDPEIGYCQGMGFIAALFITYMDEEDAFYALLAVLQRSNAPLREMFRPDMFATQQFLSVFGDLAQFHIPKLWDHLQQCGIHQSM
jgi:hypothetical protein